jgi:hypothetical protein
MPKVNNAIETSPHWMARAGAGGEEMQIRAPTR